MEAIWLILSFLCGLVAQRMRVPVLVGYLLAGFILAELNVEHTKTLEHLADLGLSLLLFTVGLHLRAKSFFRLEVIGATALHLGILTGLFTAVIWLLTGELFVELACAFGFSSTVVTVSALEKRRELDSFLGRLALGVLVVQDIVSVGIIAGDAGYELTPRALLLVLAIPICLLVRKGISLVQHRELFLVFGVGFAFLFDEAFSTLGLSGHLGALVAGALLADHQSSEHISDQLWSIKELLLLALFLSIGLYGLPSAQSIPLIVSLLVILPFKGLLFFCLFLFFRLRARTAFIASLSLTAYSEFTLVVAYYLQLSGSIPSEFLSATAVVAAISFGVCSLLIERGNFLWRVYGARLSRFQRRTRLVERSPHSFGKADVLIMGMGTAGKAAYSRAIECGHRPVGIDSDPARVSERIQEDKRVLQADGQDGSFWSEADLESIKAIIFTIPDMRAKRVAIELLREIAYKGRILALARNTQSEQELRELGVKVMVVPTIEAGRELAELVSESSMESTE